MWQLDGKTVKVPAATLATNTTVRLWQTGECLESTSQSGNIANEQESGKKRLESRCGEITRGEKTEIVPGSSLSTPSSLPNKSLIASPSIAHFLYRPDARDGAADFKVGSLSLT